MINVQKLWASYKFINAVTKCFLLAALLLSLSAQADLIGRWHFDEASGSVAEDSAGDNDGVLSGDASFLPVGIAGNAVSMSRVGNGFVNFGDIFPFTSGDFSYSFWVMMAPGDRQEATVPVGKQVSGFRNGHLVGINAWGGHGQDDKAWFYMSNDVGQGLISTTSVNDGEWHHIVASYEAGGQASLYVDGGSPEVSKTAVPIRETTGDFHVGALNWFGDDPKGLFDGYIDELQVYNHALSTEEVQFLFENPTGTQPGMQINAGLNDAWYNPLTDGQGFFVTVFPDVKLVFLAWFTFDTELPLMNATANLGYAGHRWLTAIGSYVDNQVVMNISITTDGIFDNGAAVQNTDPPGSDGTIILTFEDCKTGSVEYDITSIGRQGIVPIQRIANDNAALCEALNTNRN